jgi:Tol biopolymer transport system component
MPEVQEVFRLTTGTVRPKGGFVERQHHRQGRHTRNRRIGALVLVVALGVVAITVAWVEAPGRRHTPAGNEGWTPHLLEPYFIDLVSGAMSPLPETIAGDGVTFPVSPDGNSFAYVTCCYQPESTIFVSNVDGTGIRRITGRGIDAYGTRWSPDGSSLVYQAINEEESAGTVGGRPFGDLFIEDVRSGETTQITHIGRSGTWGWWFLAPSIAPDGSTILFHRPRRTDDGAVWDLWSVPISGGEPTLERKNAGFGAYSPDGGTMAYLSPINQISFDSTGLWVAPVDGGAPRELVTGSHIRWPKWSPDGTRIAYGEGEDIYLMDVASGTTTKVANGEDVDWFDDDTLIVAQDACPGC